MFVPEPLRGAGLGRKLMLEAEAVARERGLTGLWVDTFSFQALGFYQGLGYSVFGELTGMAGGMSRYWLEKRLAPL